MRTDAENKSMATPCATCNGFRFLHKGMPHEGHAVRCPACNPEPRGA